MSGSKKHSSTAVLGVSERAENKRRHVAPFPPSVRREALELVAQGVGRAEMGPAFRALHRHRKRQVREAARGAFVRIFADR